MTSEHYYLTSDSPVAAPEAWCNDELRKCRSLRKGNPGSRTGWAKKASKGVISSKILTLF